MSRDLPGRRSRAGKPTPMIRYECRCGRNLADVTDMSDRTHPRWDAGYEGNDRYQVTPLGGAADVRQLPGGQGYAVLCRCGKPVGLTYERIGADWQASAREGALIRVSAGDTR